MKEIKVVAAVIYTTQHPFRIFATARGYGVYKGMWEFPGGKVEQGEAPQQALKREIKEELDADVQVEGLLHTVEYDYPEFHLSMDCYWCRLIGSHLVLKEAIDAKWLEKSDLYSVQWLPADLTLIPMLESQMAGRESWESLQS